MKRILLFLSLVLTMALPSLAETATLVYSEEGYANAEDVTSTDIVADGTTVAVVVVDKGTGTNPPKYYTTGNGLRLYANNTLTINMAEGLTVSKAVFTFASSSYAFKTGLSVNSGSFTGLGQDVQTWNASTAGETSFTLISNATVRLQTIEITYTGSAVTLLPANLSFPADEYTVNIGVDFVAPVLSKDTNADVTYSSSNEAVATVDAETGAVTLLSDGVTIISATTEANDEYAAGSASYTLTVVDTTKLDVTFDFVNNDYGLTRSGDDYVTNQVISSGAVTIALNQVSGNGFRLWTDGLRVYKGTSKMTFSAPGYVITKIEYVNAKAIPVSFNVGTSEANSGNTEITWTGEADEVVATCSPTANNPIKTITVYYKPAGNPDKENVTLKFPQESYTVLSTDTFEAPELTATNAAGDPVEDLTYTYESTNEAVATVDAATGAVTIVGAGTTNIKVESAETDTYNASNTFYVLNVEKAVNSISEVYAAGEGITCYINFDMTVTYINGRNIYVIAGEESSLVFDNNQGDPSYSVGSVIPAGWKAKYSPFNGLPEIAPVGAMPVSTENVGYTYPYVTEVSLDMLNEVVILQDVEFKEATPATKASFTGTVDGKEYTFYNNFENASKDAGKYDVLVAVNTYKQALQLYALDFYVIEEVPEITLTAVNADVEDHLIVTLSRTPGSSDATQIWYKVTEPEVEEQNMERAQTNAEGYTLYTEPFDVVKGSDVTYYATVNGRSSEPQTETVTEATTGVETIVVDSAENAVYYNLQGVRVSAPAHGVYIRVIAGKAVKVVL